MLYCIVIVLKLHVRETQVKVHISLKSLVLVNARNKVSTQKNLHLIFNILVVVLKRLLREGELRQWILEVFLLALFNSLLDLLCALLAVLLVQNRRECALYLGLVVVPLHLQNVSSRDE